MTNYTTRVTYIDRETGEIISKRVAERDYIKIKSTNKKQYHEQNCRIEITNECERNRQLRAF